MLFAGLAKNRALFKRQWLELAECTENDDGFALLIFWGGLDLIAGKIKRDFGVSLAWRRKVQGVPFNRNFPAANPEEAAEIDDRSPHPSASIDDYINDAAHILVGGAQDLPAENALDFMVVEYPHRWWFHGGC